MQQHLRVAAATVDPSPAFQSRGSDRIVVLVAAATVDTDRQNQPSLPRLGTDALMVPALKSRAKLIRSLPRPGKRRLHYFFKYNKPASKFRRRDAAGKGEPLPPPRRSIEKKESRSFLSQRYQRINLRRSARGQVTSEQRDAG